MKVAIIGSRGINDFDLSPFIPKNTTEIVSGGAVGVDTVAKIYALNNNIKYTEFLPEYDKYGKSAPILRNNDIISYSDFVLAFWDGESPGTKYVIDYCNKNDIPFRVYLIKGYMSSD